VGVVFPDAGRYKWGVGHPRQDVEMTIGKLSYQFCRSLPYNDLAKPTREPRSSPEG